MRIIAMAMLNANVDGLVMMMMVMMTMMMVMMRMMMMMMAMTVLLMMTVTILTKTLTMSYLTTKKELAVLPHPCKSQSGVLHVLTIPETR